MADLDFAAAEHWIASVGRTVDVTLQTFPDDRDRRHGRPGIRGGTLAELWPWVADQQAGGCGVFVTVNRTPAGQRKSSDVLAVRALFVDIDDPRRSRPDWHLRPSLIVSSGRGLHAYWSLDPWAPADARAFRDAQQRLASYYHSDPSVCDLPRVLRLPGTLHLKQDPRQVSIVDASGASYAVQDVLQSVPPLPRPPIHPVARLDVAGGRIDHRSVDIVAICREAGLDPRRLPSADGPDPAWAIVCPWRAEHTDGAQGATSTVIWQRGARPPAFRCLHAHCSDRRLADVLVRLGFRAVIPHATIRPTAGAERALARAADRIRGLQ